MSRHARPAGWNLRYCIFAHVNGNTPQEQKDIDKAGSKGAEFMAYIRTQVVAYCLANGRRITPLDGCRIDNHAKFDDFLVEASGYSYEAPGA